MAAAIQLVDVPENGIGRENFRAIEVPVGAPQAGELAIRALYISVDPYLMMPIRAGGFENGIVRSRIIARVEQSRSPDFAAGDLVLGFARWQEHDCVPAGEMRLIRPAIPLPAYLGIAGHSGFTAILGTDILDPKPGQTVTVSSAGGMVGMVACQLVKRAGARVVAIAGGDKAERVRAMFGLDVAVDHAAPDFADRLARACPDGVDRHFENVGVKILDPVFGLANKAARVALCGMIQHYGDGDPICFAHFRRVLTQSIQIRPFSIYAHDDDYPAALARLETMVGDGALHAPETIHPGFASLPDAFLAMLGGDGIGKHLVKAAD